MSNHNNNEYENHNDDSYENNDLYENHSNDNESHDYGYSGYSDSRDDVYYGSSTPVTSPVISSATAPSASYDNHGYQFTTTNGAITSVVEIERGYAQQDRIEYGETWEVQGNQVVKTEFEHGFTQVSTYADSNNDGIFNKVSQSYLSSTPYSAGTQSPTRLNTLSLSIAGGEATDDIWVGGNSSDIYYGASGRDILRGADGDDALYGGNDNDDLYGDIGHDDLYGSSGDDLLNGGAGIDHATYTGTHDQYTISSVAGSSQVIDSNLSRDGTDRLADVERLSFSDTSVALDIDGTAGQAYRLYKAAFDRESDAQGLGYWVDALDTGSSIDSVASAFVASDEFQSRYGANVSDDGFVALLYNNVLNRDPDAAGYDYWTSGLESGTSREQLLVNFSESAENYTNTIGLIGSGIVYQEWLG